MNHELTLSQQATALVRRIWGIYRIVFECPDAELGPLEVREDADGVLILRLDRPDHRYQL